MWRSCKALVIGFVKQFWNINSCHVWSLWFLHIILVFQPNAFYDEHIILILWWTENLKSPSTDLLASQTCSRFDKWVHSLTSLELLLWAYTAQLSYKDSSGKFSQWFLRSRTCTATFPLRICPVDSKFFSWSDHFAQGTAMIFWTLAQCSL